LSLPPPGVLSPPRLLLGVAVALFPVISGFIEHYFNLRIENAKQVNALAQHRPTSSTSI
jgi:hypothetical protein